MRGEMREEFRGVRAEMATMQRTMVQLFVTMMVGFAGTIATILATHG